MNLTELMLCDDAYTLGELPQTDPGQQEKGDEELVEIVRGRTKKASSRGQRSPIQSMRSWPTEKIWVHTKSTVKTQKCNKETVKNK